jgi:hypothetical protein
VGRYESEYNNILANMKSQDLDEAARAFVENEAGNYVLFEYVNGLINENKQLEEEYDSKLRELEKFKGDYQVHPAKLA